MSDHLLVPLDGSDESLIALDYALALAPALRVEVHLLWAWEGLVGLDLAIPYPEQAQLTQREVARRLDWLEEVGGSRCSRAGVGWMRFAPVGPPASQIARQAGPSARYIVMTTHGRGGFERWKIGSVADEVARVSPVPVIFVRPEADSRHERVPRRLVVPHDGTALGEHALAEAVTLAQAFGGEITLLQARNPVTVGAGFAAVTDQARLLKAQGEYQHKQLDALARQLPVPAHVHVQAEDARTAVLAATREADLVVLASRGRWGVRRLLLGSVSDAALRAAEGPILIVPVHPPPRRRWGGPLRDRLAGWRAHGDGYLRRLGFRDPLEP